MRTRPCVRLCWWLPRDRPASMPAPWSRGLVLSSTVVNICSQYGGPQRRLLRGFCWRFSHDVAILLAHKSLPAVGGVLRSDHVIAHFLQGTSQRLQTHIRRDAANHGPHHGFSLVVVVGVCGGGEKIKGGVCRLSTAFPEKRTICEPTTAAERPASGGTM